jgi:hypothetical protein
MLSKLAIAAVVAAGVLASSGEGALTTGKVSVTCSAGQCGSFYGWSCHGPVDLDRLTVRMDVPAGAKGKARDAVYLGAGCTGRIGKLVVSTNGGDGIKIAGAHDLAIDDGTVTCSGRYRNVHQDGIQVMGGSRITLTGLRVDCTTANDAQLRISRAGDAAAPPEAVVCVACVFRPGPAAFHDVTVGISTNSGVTGSVICPAAAPRLVLDSSRATNPVDANNTFPRSC